MKEGLWVCPFDQSESRGITSQHCSSVKCHSSLILSIVPRASLWPIIHLHYNSMFVYKLTQCRALFHSPYLRVYANQGIHPAIVLWIPDHNVML